MRDADSVFNVNTFKNLEEEASWLRNDIKSTNLEDKVKNLLLSLNDEELVRRVNKAEDEIILKKLENRANTENANAKRYTLEDVRAYARSRKIK